MNMKSFLKKLHITSNHSEDAEGSNSSSRGSKYGDALSSPTKSLVGKSSPQATEHKPLSGFSGWFNSVTNRSNSNQAQALSTNGARVERIEPTTDLVSSGALDIGKDALTCDSGCGKLRDPDVEEEYQIQVALELSAREDPEAVQIEAVKQISLGSFPPENTPAEILAYRYWNYHSLSYEDKIMDGFYDLYGVITAPTSERMPSLVDLQGTPVSEGVTWEAVLVNKVSDPNLHKLEQKALSMAIKSRLGPQVSLNGELVQKLALIVSDHMGGPVGDPENTLKQWQSLSYSLKANIGTMVLPLGSLKVGLARHRSLLFKVLADSVGLPCRLMKGHQYTGSDSVAMSFVKTEDGREYIVDLMADPGTLIPSDAAGSQIDCDDSDLTSPFSRDMDYSHVLSSGSVFGSSASAGNESEDRSQISAYSNLIGDNNDGEDYKVPANMKEPGWDLTSRPNFPYTHGRSPSWTEGVTSPAVRRMKVKDVSQYMIDAAKENPQLAQKLHDVLLESGVVAPANLFAEVLPEELEVVRPGAKAKGAYKNRNQEDRGRPRFLPPLPYHGIQSKAKHNVKPERHNLVEEVVGVHHPQDPNESGAQFVKNVKNVPVAAAAAAAAAAVASSMVVAAVKSNVDSTLELPVAAAATAVAVVATTAAVSKQYEHLETSQLFRGGASCLNQADCTQSDEDVDHQHDALGPNQDGDKVSDKSIGNDSTKSDVVLDDVSDCEIPWDEITVGERIGLGSYGEVYRGDWHGTEVAVKRFLDQDLCGESLEEFKSEVRIMKRVRHPNVVLFMGAVTRPPNLSIITEFLPRGSLYRLIHRPNNQLDPRRRLRMAFDAARGMNYLHTSSPVIVHRDLKSPNLLVDKNWVVKVCDFGLSRIKQSTYLSSRSTAGTAEWMAPEVLRNEPSDEKCDVFSYGVILWELTTLQQPWGGMNPMQVVGAVGFQHRRLDIPDDVDPVVADIIRKCWQTDPKQRPTFTEIMAALKPLQRPVTNTQVSRANFAINS